MTSYREAIRTALAVHRDYRAFDAAEYYDAPLVRCATVPAVTYWYGTDGRVHYYDDAAGDYVIPDRRTYRALAVLLAVAPIGGRSYLGMPVRTAAAVAALALTAGIALAAVIPPRCAVVEHGLTGPEATVTIGRTVEACSDGTTRITEWYAGDDGYPVLTPAEYADVLARYEVIRDARTGGRFNEGSY